MSQNNSTNVCVDIREELEAEMVDVYFPVIVYLSLFMMFGIIGNVFTFYIYCYKFEISTTQMFVVALSVCDLLTCAICIPFDIVLLHHSFTFSSDIVCRLMVFFVAIVVISSGFIVFMIAIDRYRLVCRPLEEQISFENSKKILLSLILLSTFLSSPMLLLHSQGNRLVRQCGNIGEICSLTKSWQRTVFPFVYYIIGVTSWLLIFIVLMILYSLIAIRIAEIDKVKKYRLSQVLKFSSIASQFDEGEDEETPPSIPKFRCVRRHSLHPTQTNFIFFVITLLWVTSYVPHFISIFWKLSVENFYDTVTQSDQQLSAFLLLSYYPNCAINPYVYGLCNRQFRVELRDLFHNIRALGRK
ncbi:cholecystokinin receptor type A [Octopus bimaculoides]|uniref:G-protein coupled receptors family 1 profile domain-containing protein n=1 Tax=Octopus bimaculoides TaxID=37653 RepID=A0A0L8HTN0_OCTBM|nr:cholecystokinin receptor type A [Octopus bimaculoides]XP_052830326.1 cholecystokinin receptor type A [Octopus bimaculoides]|eukprot:XP_014769527.1 PREDICTED: cholecystokinin receptor type A-like [Octopus bimaculoides]